jgi:hypothetical protein
MERDAVRGDARLREKMKKNIGGRRAAWASERSEEAPSGYKGLNRLLEHEVATRTWRKTENRCRKGRCHSKSRKKKNK